jgi:predicted double-glycine peptidase
VKAPARALFLAEERSPARSLREIRQENVIVQRWDASCAAAALATIPTYYLKVRITP